MTDRRCETCQGAGELNVAGTLRPCQPCNGTGVQPMTDRPDALAPLLTMTEADRLSCISAIDVAHGLRHLAELHTLQMLFGEMEAQRRLRAEQEATLATLREENALMESECESRQFTHAVSVALLDENRAKVAAQAQEIATLKAERETVMLTLHKCKVCGTRWLLWPDAIPGGGWNLLDRDQRPGACCDNAQMGEQIEHLRDLPLTIASTSGHRATNELVAALRAQVETLTAERDSITRTNTFSANGWAKAEQRIARLTEALENLAIEQSGPNSFYCLLCVAIESPARIFHGTVEHVDGCALAVR